MAVAGIKPGGGFFVPSLLARAGLVVRSAAPASGKRAYTLLKLKGPLFVHFGAF
jgi:hypothetical protein